MSRPEPDEVLDGVAQLVRRVAAVNDRPAILDWSSVSAAPLPNESTAEHVRNALQLLCELETHPTTRETRELLADVKRRLGWALAAEARAAR